MPRNYILEIFNGECEDHWYIKGITYNRTGGISNFTSTQDVMLARRFNVPSAAIAIKCLVHDCGLVYVPVKVED